MSDVLAAGLGGREIDLFGRDLHYHIAVSVTVVLLAVGSALCFALASASQHAATQTIPPEESLRPRLVLRLVHRPLWIAGNVADAGGFALMFLAFRRGSLALIEPLLVSGLLFALLIGAALTRHRLSRGDWIGAALVVVGVSGFVIAAAPGSSHPTASGLGWVLLGVVSAAIIGVLLILDRPFPHRRATLFGAAAGLLNGVLGALTDATARTFDAGVVAALHRWQPYTLAVVGVASILLVQSAFQAGPLSESLPVLTATEAIGGIAIGQLLFGERIASYWLARSVELVGLAVLCYGIALLGRSPLVVPADNRPGWQVAASQETASDSMNTPAPV